jgi:hypothetical protein
MSATKKGEVPPEKLKLYEKLVATRPRSSGKARASPTRR